MTASNTAIEQAEQVVERTLATLDDAVLEQLMVGGDLTRLSNAQRLEFYNYRCQSLKLDPASKPFDYIALPISGGGKRTTLYLNRTGAEQLRRVHGISIRITERHWQQPIPDHPELITAGIEVEATDHTGRIEAEEAWMNLFGHTKSGGYYPFTGDRYTNALMHLATKAKRRATIAITGAGALDETEIRSIPDAHQVMVDAKGHILTEIEAEPVDDYGPVIGASEGSPTSSDDEAVDTDTGEIIDVESVEVSDNDRERGAPAELAETWSDFWPWARDRGYDNAVEVATLLGVPVPGNFSPGDLQMAILDFERGAA